MPVGFDKDDITPILPITMTLTRTCNQQASVLGLAVAGATLFMLEVRQPALASSTSTELFLLSECEAEVGFHKALQLPSLLLQMLSLILSRTY